MWLRSWCTHSCSRSRTVRKPTRRAPRPGQARRGAARGQLPALRAHAVELGDERAAVARAVVPLARHDLLIPALQLEPLPRPVARVQDEPDAPGEAAALALDQVPQHLLHAPLAGRGM